jgi:hypothetical protein
MSPGAILVWTVWGNSHFDVMTKYYEHRRRGPYATEHEWDMQPYPDDWARRQHEAGVV